MYYTFICSWQLSSECYRKRSDVEQVFSMVKGKFRDSVRPRSDGGADERGTGEGSLRRYLRARRAARKPGTGPASGADRGARTETQRLTSFLVQSFPKTLTTTYIYVKCT